MKSEFPGGKLGIDPDDFDQSVRPQDDFYRFTNGGWIDQTEIPDERSNWSALAKMYEEADDSIRATLDRPRQRGSEARGEAHG